MTNMCADLTVCLFRTSFLHTATMKMLLWNLHIWADDFEIANYNGGEDSLQGDYGHERRQGDETTRITIHAIEKRRKLRDE